MKDEGINDKFHSMGVLLLLDCPDGLEFGIDNIAWKTGTKFKGLKLIPLGTHIIAYSLQSENNMFKISHFVHLSEEKRILIHRWNAQVQ
jgi:A1 cistron-splicing factor AAR2